MKILFAIQGTGNGHLSRARDIYPELVKHGNVDVLVSGIQADVNVPFPVKYRFYGMSFIFGKRGGVSIVKTLKRLNLIRLLRDIRNLPVEQYDLVINDFEPVSAWACKLKKIKCVSLSHQAAVLHPNAPKPKQKDLIGHLVLKYYAPTHSAYGFHFKNYGSNIFTPVIRREIRSLIPRTDGHYTVYLPAYDDETIVKHLSQFNNVRWEVFSKHNKTPFTKGNISVQQIDNDAFIASMASSTGVLCGAGFEGPSEALFLGKKLLVIPMQTQYEQHCNAAGLQDLGVPVIQSLSEQYYSHIQQWLCNDHIINISFPDITTELVAGIIAKETSGELIPEAVKLLME